MVPIYNNNACRDLGETIVYEDIKVLFNEFDTDESGKGSRHVASHTSIHAANVI
jgi:hypothetical protein